MPHDYLSTACYHERHGECYRSCRFCTTACRCNCHEPAVASTGQCELNATRRRRLLRHSHVSMVGQVEHMDNQELRFRTDDGEVRTFKRDEWWLSLYFARTAPAAQSVEVVGEDE